MKHHHPRHQNIKGVIPALVAALVWTGAASATDALPTEVGELMPDTMASSTPSGEWHGDGPAPPMPDDNSAINDGRAPALTFSYYTVSGATIRGRSSTAGYTYQGVGCTYSTTVGDRWLNTELPIPDGATIKYLRIYYYDSDASGTVTAYLTRYQPGDNAENLTSISSTAAFAGGNGTSLSPEITHVVDNTNHAYTLLTTMSASSLNLRICGMRIAYYAP